VIESLIQPDLPAYTPSSIYFPSTKHSKEQLPTSVYYYILTMAVSESPFGPHHSEQPNLHDDNVSIEKLSLLDDFTNEDRESAKSKSRFFDLLPRYWYAVNLALSFGNLLFL
jgi:hypothetical protein